METNKTRDSMERLVAQRIRFQYGDARPILHWICSSRSPPSKSEPSSSNSLAETTSHFFKVILSATLQDKKLHIPNAFVAHCGKLLPKKAVFSNHMGNFWHVDVVNTENGVHFLNGWHNKDEDCTEEEDTTKEDDDGDDDDDEATLGKSRA
ncbi:hypothetical protein QYF36_012654 [Acer negundo]|nr:hypothetical protein QYF36_012654 [Acer negundo]